MAQQQGGDSAQDSEADGQPGREQAAAIAAQRAAADAAIAAIAGGRQTLAAMTTPAAAAARSAETVDSKREADLAARESTPEQEQEDGQGPAAEGAEAAVREPAGAREPDAPAEADQGPETEAEVGPAAPPSVPRPAARIRPAPPRPVREDGPLPALGDDAVSRWLAAENAPDSFRRLLYAEFGDGPEAAERLAGDPWLALELPAAAPALVDRLAAALLGTGERQLAADPRRSRALVGWNLRRAAHAGHTAVAADEMARALGPQVPDPAGAIADAVEHGAALVFADRIALASAKADQGSDDDGEAEFEAVDAADDDDPVSMLTSPYTLLALDRWAFAEQSAAEAVQRLLATATPLEPGPAAESAGRAQAERVDRVVEEAARSGVTLVTGADPALPGRVAAAFPGAVLASPSPAGLRALAALGDPAIDLRALSGDSGAFDEAVAVVLADAQLLPLELGAELLELLPDGAHLVLCGDPGTLPATGPGRLFRDLLEIDDPEFGGRVPRVELKARPTGPLTALVDAVRYGGLPPMEILGDGGSNEVKIIPVRDPAETRLRTVQLVADSIPRALGFGGEQVQAVAMREQGPAGAQDLNAAVKERVNPGPGVCAGLDAGDRVVVREGGRLAQLGLLGGETGTVVAANAQGLTLRIDQPAHAVRPDGEPSGTVDLDVHQARALRHAWVLTLREAQGGHWPAVVAVLDGGSAAALTRSAVLGAFATAERHLSVVHGAGPALAEAVEKRPHTPSRTRLAQTLRS